MSIFGEIGSFITDNKDWLKPLVSTGLGALRQSNIDNSQSEYLNYLRQKEDENYRNSVDQINAYNASLAGMGSGGGGDGGAAARATEANRQKAAKKANKSMQKTYKEILEMYAPLKDTVGRLLPQMTGTYEGSLGLQNALASYVQRPEQIAKLNASVPAWQVNVPLPDSVRLK